MSSFDRDVQVILDREGRGPAVQLKGDRGGLTRFGISSLAYPHVDIAGLTIDQAVAIYQRDYWRAIAADGLPDPLALYGFDMAVNCGVPAAKRTLGQEQNPEEFLWRRLAYYVQVVRAHPTDLPFLPGWVMRLLLVRKAAA